MAMMARRVSEQWGSASPEKVSVEASWEQVKEKDRKAEEMPLEPGDGLVLLPGRLCSTEERWVLG